MKNLEQLLTLAIKNNIINITIKDSLIDYAKKEFPEMDLYKNELLENSLKIINQKENNSKEDFILEEVMTFGEAQEYFSLGPSTLRKNVDYNRYRKGEVRRSKGTWLITLAAIRRLYPKQYYAKVGGEKFEQR